MWLPSSPVLPRRRFEFSKNCLTSVVILTAISSVSTISTNYTLENISCHYSAENDALPLLDKDFKPPTYSIFFHETSCRGNLNSRQACAVESAARVHPLWQVHLLFSGPVIQENLNNGTLGALKKFRNVKVMRLNIVDYANGTLMDDMIRGGALNRSRWRVSHTSDVLRYLTLYKWGGVYLDLDMVVVKAFSTLARNWAVRESETAVNSAALSFSSNRIGRIVASAAIWVLKANYNGYQWGSNGPGVITRILKRICRTEIPNMSAKVCKGFEVYGPEVFYPVGITNASLYFSSEPLDVGDPYTHHIWNAQTSGLEVTKDSAYAKLAQRYCPTVYQLYGDLFGM